jgi:hypothetical protein
MIIDTNAIISTALSVYENGVILPSLLHESKVIFFNLPFHEHFFFYQPS